LKVLLKMKGLEEDSYLRKLIYLPYTYGPLGKL